MQTVPGRRKLVRVGLRECKGAHQNEEVDDEVPRGTGEEAQKQAGVRAPRGIMNPVLRGGPAVPPVLVRLRDTALLFTNECAELALNDGSGYAAAAGVSNRAIDPGNSGRNKNGGAFAPPSVKRNQF